MGLTKIEWTFRPQRNGTLAIGYTANIWTGCTKVHAGCDHCYAEAQTHRWGKECWGDDNPRIEVKSVWDNLIKWNKDALKAGEIRNVFVGSLMDIGEKTMPIVSPSKVLLPSKTGDFRDLFYEQVVPTTSNLYYLLLSKRPSNYAKQVPEEWLTKPPKNVMYGTSPVDQETFDNLWLHLARIPGKRFLSIEPMLAPFTMKAYCPSCDKLLSGSLSKMCGTCHTPTIKPDWAIVGGESGPKRRPFALAWANSIYEQCRAANIPFFFKQIDKVREHTEGIPVELQVREYPKFWNA